MHESKNKLLFDLTDDKKLGFKRLTEIVTMCDGLAQLISLFVPLLNFLCDPSLSAPLNLRNRNRIIVELYHVPFFIGLVSENVRKFPQVVLPKLCRFLKVMALGLLEARSCQSIREMALYLRDLGVDEAAAFCSVLMIDSDSDATTAATLAVTVDEHKEEICWVTDRVPPGGRHDNDKVNFRDISIVPTSMEVACEMPPYLPLASQANRFVHEADDLGHLLDSQFRLLREDFMKPLREAVESDRCLQGVQAVDLFVPFKKFGKPCVVFKFDKPKKLEGKSEKECRDFWERFRGLEIDTLVCFRKNNTPVFYGTVAMSENDKSWLNHPDGPFLGIEFDREDDLAVVLSELHSSVGAPYELLTASQSFFTYKPILACLQQMDSLPLSAQILSGIDAGVRPRYLPTRLRLPRDFGGVSVNLSEWDDLPLREGTTLDASQIDSLRLAFSTEVSLIQGPPGGFRLSCFLPPCLPAFLPSYLPSFVLNLFFLLSFPV